MDTFFHFILIILKRSQTVPKLVLHICGLLKLEKAITFPFLQPQGHWATGLSWAYAPI